MTGQSPEQLAAIEAAQAKIKARIEKAKIAVNSAVQDENIRILLAYLSEICGFRDNPVVLNQNKEITNATNYNIGRTAIFHELRKLMSAETENLILKREE